jgi:hypothetical protein
MWIYQKSFLNFDLFSGVEKIDKRGQICLYPSCLHQCCGSGLFFTGSRSGLNFLKHLDPDLDLNKFSAKLLLKFFWQKYAQKIIVMTQKVRKQRFLKYVWLLHTPKKLI